MEVDDDLARKILGALMLGKRRERLRYPFKKNKFTGFRL